MSTHLTPFVLVLFLLTACMPGGQTGGQDPGSTPAAADQHIRIAQLGLPASMSPEASNSYIPTFWSMYDPLTSLDGDYNVVPSVAERWTQVNPTTWRFTIRQDMTFSNGERLTAADVAFTGQLMLNNRTPQITQFANLTSVTAVDEWNVDFTTSIPDASVLPGGAYLWIMPDEYYNRVGQSGFTANPVGTGPYTLEDFRSGDIAVFAKRSTDHPFRQARPSRLTFRSITEQTQMTTGLRTGDLDVLIGQISPDQIDAMSQTNAVIDSRLVSVTSMLISQPEAEMRNTPLQDRRVRLALNYAVNKESIAQNIYFGQARPTGQISVPSSPSWNDDINPIPYDPAMARQLLAEAGYPNGFTLPVGIEYTPLTGNSNLVLAVQGNLREVGIEAPVREYELGVFLDKFYGRAGQTKGDLFVFGTGDSNGFATTIYGYFTCEKPLDWWCNPQFDTLMQQAYSEADVSERGPIMQDAIAVLREDIAAIFLLNVPTFVVRAPSISGFTWTSDYFYNFDSVVRTQ